MRKFFRALEVVNRGTVTQLQVSEKSNLVIQILTLVLLNCFNCIFRHLKLELLTQFPASNDKKILLFMKNRHV